MKKILIIISLILLLSLTYAGIKVWPSYSNLKAEYETADLIRSVEDYIDKQGTWPKSDKDLGRKFSKLVFIDYSLSIYSIIKDPNLLKQSLKPKSDIFYTYPHYERDLESLLNTIKKNQN